MKNTISPLFTSQLILSPEGISFLFCSRCDDQKPLFPLLIECEVDYIFSDLSFENMNSCDVINAPCNFTLHPQNLLECF